MNKIFKEIQPPISNYHNILLEISNSINGIFDIAFDNLKIQSDIEKAKFNKLISGNYIIFTDTSILLFGFIEIREVNKETVIKILGEIVNTENYSIVEIVINNYNKLRLLFNKYFFVVNILLNTYDSSISTKTINTIFQTVMDAEIEKVNTFLLPYKDKILNSIDDKTLRNLIDKFEYIISFKQKVNNFIEYKIQRVVSSDLSIITTIDNLRYLEKEVVLTNVVENTKFEDFLKKLYYYGDC
jgi:hypothetical protein